jgi:hypothetical protein
MRSAANQPNQPDSADGGDQTGDPQLPHRGHQRQCQHAAHEVWKKGIGDTLENEHERESRQKFSRQR